jgi:hypothetical protein
MNRTNDRDFFRLWDFECSLEKMRETHLSPKQRAEVEALEDQFFDEAGYYPSYTGYESAISNYQRNQ